MAHYKDLLKKTFLFGEEVMKTTIEFKDLLLDYLEGYNLTKEEFARRIKITPKHLGEILSGKVSLSLNTITNISVVTNIPFNFLCNLEKQSKLEKEIYEFLLENNLTLKKYLQKFNVKLLLETNYIDLHKGLDDIDTLKEILNYVRLVSRRDIYDMSSKYLFKSSNDKPELLILWLEKCYRKSIEQNLCEYSKNGIEKIVLKIKKFARNNEFCEDKLVSLFNDFGIALVIEDDLLGSKIRGAFKVHNNKPAIYITRKHRRIADIYFALLHELAHCKTNYNTAKNKSYISYVEDVESIADETAFNWMIPNSDVEKILDKDYCLDNEKTLPKSFVVYYLARKNKISYSCKMYQENNKLVSL